MNMTGASPTYRRIKALAHADLLGALAELNRYAADHCGLMDGPDTFVAWAEVCEVMEAKIKGRFGDKE